MDKWTRVALVAAGGVNFALLLYLVWNARNAERKAVKELEQQLTEIKISVDTINRDIGILKQELRPEPVVRRARRHRQQVASEVDSEFQSTYETRNGDSDNFFDFSEEETNSKPNRKSLEDILSEVDLRDIECQTDSGACEEVLKLLLELCPIQPLDTSSLPSAEVGWRVSRCYIHSVGHMKQSGMNLGHISETTRKGIEFAEAAIRLDNDSWISHKWYAICCGTLSQSESTQEKVRLGAEYKEHLEIAMKLAPNEPTLCHLLGNWYFELSELSWVTRKAATTLYGDTFSGTLEQAEDMFLRAETFAPGFWIRNRIFLAKCCLKKGDKSGAESWTKKALSMEVAATPDDTRGMEEAHKLAEEQGWN